jgi:hypothetical protein
MKLSQILVSIFGISIQILCAGCGQSGSEWAGSISRDAGVVVVKNPIEPKYGSEVFSLEEELSIGESEGSDEYMFQDVTGITVNGDGDIYVLDSEAKHVKVFDRHGQYLRTFGKEGEGPGEFQLPRSIECMPWEEIIVSGFNRISYFDLQGEYLRNLPMSLVRLSRPQHDTDGNILGLVIDREKEVYVLQKFDKDLNLLMSFTDSPLPTSGEYRNKRSILFPVLRWDVINDDQVVCGFAGDGYVIEIFDGAGTLLRRIEKEYDPVEVDQKDAKELLEGYPAQLRDTVYAPKHYPPYRTVSTDDQGRIFVITYEKTPNEEGYMFDVFDAEGIYIAKIQMKSSPRIFKNSRMYTVEENEDGFHVIKRYRIGWNLQ